jgi:hypothetical protein
VDAWYTLNTNIVCTRQLEQSITWVTLPTKQGAHLLLQMRVKTLNGELGGIFKRWYPDMQMEQVVAEAA